MFLQSDLLRIISFTTQEDGSAHVEEIHGTGFLFREDGIFLTAAHVLNSALATSEKGWTAGVAGNPGSGTQIAKINCYDFAPTGQDIAIGASAYRFKPWYSLGMGTYHVWQRVAAAGYPEDAFINDEEKLTTPLRAHKGIIQRIIEPGHLALSPKAVGFELNFSPAPGISGAPLFIYKESHGEVIGVCVGSFRSEKVEDEITEVNEKGEKYTERRVRVTQFGLAESLTPLKEWQPDFLGGAKLGDMAVAK